MKEKAGEEQQRGEYLGDQSTIEMRVVVVEMLNR